jgi:hypothetical protein
MMNDLREIIYRELILNSVTFNFQHLMSYKTGFRIYSFYKDIGLMNSHN